MTNQTHDPVEGCPTCGSPSPERHPAVQCEGEVELCVDDFHLTPTEMNSPAYVEAVQRKRETLRNQAEQSSAQVEPVQALVERVRSLRRELELRFCGLMAENAINTLDAVQTALQQSSEREAKLTAALRPFAEAFAKSRVRYSRRYKDKELGARNFDNMPDHWPMEVLTFSMGEYRRATEALGGSDEA